MDFEPSLGLELEATEDAEVVPGRLARAGLLHVAPLLLLRVELQATVDAIPQRSLHLEEELEERTFLR